MTYTPTNRPVPSDAPEDLYFNSSLLDQYANSPNPTMVDRTGVTRKTIAGIGLDGSAVIDQFEDDAAAALVAQNAAFQGFLNSLGRVDKGTYAAGIVLNTRSDVFYRSGFYYRAAPGTVLPYTTTGVWASESSKFVVDFGPTNLMPEFFAAQGDGTSDDTAAFTTMEASVTGKLVNLNGRTYVVTALPAKNGYFNGNFKVGGFTKPAVLAAGYDTQPPHFHKFGGGQLQKLFQGLSNPLEQICGVVFLGDSQTWGSGNTGEQAPTDPRDKTLSDPRDYFGTSSFVNIVKRYIGARFAKGVTPVLSNHPTSPSGESIATYTAPFLVYPYQGDFTTTQAAGASLSITENFNSAINSGAQLRLTNGNAAVESSHSITFKFTGTSFQLGLGCVDVDATYYEVIVDGVSQGVFSTHSGTDGFVSPTSNNYRTHTFPYVRDKIVEIKSRRNGETGLRILRVETLKIDKVIRLTNNGLNGITSFEYRTLNLTGSPADGLAVLPDDNHVIVKIGTNDRIFAAGRPRGSNYYKYNLGLFLDAVLTISPTANIVMMCSNPAVNDSPPTYSFGMQEVRNVIYQTAKARTLDMVDTYATFSNVTLQPGFSLDGLHLNALGYTVEARNFINALEQA